MTVSPRRASRHWPIATVSVALATSGALLVACTDLSAPATGAARFAQDCAACHGSNARGGPGGTSLTELTRTNDGTFPAQRVLDRLDGYGRGTATAARSMPEFGHLLTGRLVRMELEDGTTRPYPEPVIALTRYLESIQEPAG